MITPISNPFQCFRGEKLGYFHDAYFNDEHNLFCEECIGEMREFFTLVIENGKYWEFTKAYTSLAYKILERTGDKRLHVILDGALFRLIVYAHYLRSRTRYTFFENRSVFHFEIDKLILSNAIAQVGHMENEGIGNCSYDLNQSPVLKKWISEKIQPMIEGYIGYPVMFPKGELRYADSKIHMDSINWASLRLHKYSNFHYDQSIFANPLIIYLSDVDETSGPFTYVNGSDKLPHDYVSRSMHSTLTHECGIGGLKNQDFALIAALPLAFRGGDSVGMYSGIEVFEESDIVEVKGPTGLGVLFNGFHLVHSGGKPPCGTRKSLLISFKYPTNKLFKYYGQIASLYYRYRVRYVLN